MATQRMQIYQCEVCGNVAEMVRPGGGKLICCGQPMNLISENTTDAAVEKHVPVVEKGEGCVTVKVGSVAHPMTEEHYIEWIEGIAGDHVVRKHLKPGEDPQAIFPCGCQCENVTFRAFCNLHGLWKTT